MFGFKDDCSLGLILYCPQEYERDCVDDTEQPQMQDEYGIFEDTQTVPR